jgi:hypothetical protein
VVIHDWSGLQRIAEFDPGYLYLQRWRSGLSCPGLNQFRHCEEAKQPEMRRLTGLPRRFGARNDERRVSPRRSAFARPGAFNMKRLSQ